MLFRTLYNGVYPMFLRVLMMTSKVLPLSWMVSPLTFSQNITLGLWWSHILTTSKNRVPRDMPL